jgi:hypothetical protein
LHRVGYIVEIANHNDLAGGKLTLALQVNDVIRIYFKQKPALILCAFDAG